MARFVLAASACLTVPSLSHVFVPRLGAGILGSRFVEPPHGQFELEKGKQYQMPIMFGSRSPDATPTLEHPDEYNIFFQYEVDASVILPILPQQVELLKPQITVVFVQSSNLTWLSGRSYSSVTVSVPVRYDAPDGVSTEGQFNLVEFDNMAEPMLLGRDLAGSPRVYANISLEQSQSGSQQVHVWYDQGPNGKTEFLTLDVTPPVLSPTKLDGTPTRANTLNWRYFPSSAGSENAASVSELVNLPIDVAVSEHGWAQDCQLMWTKPNASANDPPGLPGWFMMPTEWRFANALADMPRRNVQCGVSRGQRSLRLDRVSILYDLLHSTDQGVGSAASMVPPHGSFDPAANNTEFRMPISFGGDRTNGTAGIAYYPSTENLWLAYDTDVEALLPLVPSGLVLLNPQVVVGLTDAASVDWLAGRGYNMITVSISVGYPMPNGTLLESSICLVVWEDWSDCLITGREMSGVPKIWADIDFKNGTDSKAVRAAWGGLTFLEASIELGPLQHVSDQPKTMGHGFQWKYFPKPDAADIAEISELTDYPQESRLQSQANGTRCNITWLPGRPVDKPVSVDEVPEQHKILNALAGLPIRSEPLCGLTNSEVWLRNDLSNVVVANFGQGAGELLV